MWVSFSYKIGSASEGGPALCYICFLSLRPGLAHVVAIFWMSIVSSQTSAPS